jgi:hypothetical protein
MTRVTPRWDEGYCNPDLLKDEGYEQKDEGYTIVYEI